MEPDLAHDSRPIYGAPTYIGVPLLGPHQPRYIESTLYIFAKNICYIRWNQGVWWTLHNTYLTIEVPGIWCTNQLHVSWCLTYVNPHFTTPRCRYCIKINSCWPIVTSSIHEPATSYCDVTMTDCSHGFLWTHDVEVGKLRDCNNFAYCGRMIHGSLWHTGRPNNISMA